MEQILKYISKYDALTHMVKSDLKCVQKILSDCRKMDPTIESSMIYKLICFKLVACMQNHKCTDEGSTAWVKQRSGFVPYLLKLIDNKESIERIRNAVENGDNVDLSGLMFNQTKDIKMPEDKIIKLIIED